MRDGALALYIRRKRGQGQKPGWRLRAVLPTLLLLFVSLALSFAIVFIDSMSSGLADVISVLGSGDLVVYDEVLPASLEGGDAEAVRSAAALAASQDATALVSVKGVDGDYLSGHRGSVMDMRWVENTTGLNGIVLSRMLASKLGVEAGGRVVLMIHDASLGRVRPVYFFIEGLYSTGYADFDETLVYISQKLVDGDLCWEVMVDGDADALASSLRSQGYVVASSRQLYPGLWANLDLSVGLLSTIVVLIAFLAGFFAISVAAEYLERDRHDIALLSLEGVEEGRIAHAYLSITLFRVVVAVSAGIVLGLLAAMAFIPFLSSLDAYEVPALQSYVTNFSVRIPIPTLLLMFLALVSSSWISLRFSLSRSLRKPYRMLTT